MASTLITAPPAHGLIRNQIFVTIETDEMSGGSAPYTPDQDNLSCRLEVWRDTDAGEEMLLRVKPKYSTFDKRTSVDIHGAFIKVQALPSKPSIGISPGTDDSYYGEAVGLVDTYRLRHADQYGDPVTPETLTVEGDYIAINGGLPADAVQSINWAGAAIGLHSYYYRRSDSFIFRKPVGRMQPDWMYFVALVTDTFRATVTIRYTDGTTSTFDAIEMADIEANTAYWIQCGYAQLKIDDHATADKVVSGYDVSIIRDTGPVNAYTAFFVLDEECPSWERYILYHNGFGGYETVRMKGVTKYAHVVDRQSFERTRWTDFDVDTGTIDDLSVLGGSVFNTHMGHYPSYYVDHLRQLLHGKLWLVDMSLTLLNEYRFLRIQCQTNQVEVRSDVPAADGFAITYRHSWLDDGFNIY